MAKLPDGCVDLIATDPPYGINYVTNHRSKEHDTRGISREVANDTVWSDYWFGKVVEAAYRILRLDRHAYFFCPDETLPQMVQSIRSVFTFKNILVWKKGNWTAGDLEGAYGKECEFIIFAHKGRRPLIGGRPSSHLAYPRVSPDKTLHSCQKPTPLMSYLIEHSTHPGEIVCDPFVGSGSTAVAAMGCGRDFIGWEMDPKTYGIAKSRLEQEATQPNLF
jgi:DNA modification methylase